MGLEKNFPNREQPVWAPEEQVPADLGRAGQQTVEASPWVLEAIAGSKGFYTIRFAF